MKNWKIPRNFTSLDQIDTCVNYFIDIDDDKSFQEARDFICLFNKIAMQDILFRNVPIDMLMNHIESQLDK